MERDKYFYYQNSVQCVEAEIDFVEQTYQLIRNKPPVKLREDFCGTAATSCEWLKRDSIKQAWGVDCDETVLQWSKENNISQLTPQQYDRIQLVSKDVRFSDVFEMDVILAMNFSYYIFMTREEMLKYFQTVKNSLNIEGLFFLDAFGGYEAAKELVEERDCGDFTYVWEQASFNPISSGMQCYIHFNLTNGKRLDRAFSYYWRLWTLPEIIELLLEAGFTKADVYWEGTDEVSGEGNGIYKKTSIGTADAGWICYVVAEL